MQCSYYMTQQMDTERKKKSDLEGVLPVGLWGWWGLQGECAVATSGERKAEQPKMFGVKRSTVASTAAGA